MKYNVSNPKDREKRTIKRFAWLPETIKNGEIITIIWLEFYELDQEFVKGQEFKSTYWEEIDRRVIKKK